MKRTVISIAALLIALLSSTSIAYSQGCVAPSNEEGVSLFGFFQPQFDYALEDEHKSTFRFNRMRIGAIGTIPYDFSYYGLIETSPFINGDGSMFLIDAFVTYSRFQNFRVSAGSFKKPFGAELSMPCSGLFTIDRSEFVNELTGPSNRDIGLMILGGSDTTMIEYRVAVMNGTGPVLRDDNAFKDLYGRLIVKPLRGVTFGLNAMVGRSISATDPSTNDEQLRLGADIGLNYQNLFLMSEYIYSSDKGTYTTGGGCDGSDVQVHEGSIERGGFYIMSGYTWGNLMPVVKFELYDRDLETGLRDIQTITYGINYYFNDWTRLQLNYRYKAEDPKEVSNDAISVQIQVKF